MRYPASEKLEIIRIVEQSHLPAKRTLEKLGIARRTFCRWYDRYLSGGPEALEDRLSAPGRVWNRIPADIHDQIIELALENCELSPRELAVRFTDERRYFVSEATVYRLLKAHDLITSPAYVVIKAADAFHTQTTLPNEMWQTDFGLAPRLWRAFSLLRGQPFELKRADEVERRMAPDGVVEAVDVVADRGCRLDPALEDGAPDELGLERLEEGLDHGVIKAVSFARHRDPDAVSTQFGLVVQGAVLAAPVSMMDQSSGRAPHGNGPAQGRQRQFLV